MRIWDLPCCNLCTRHLVAEHRELHGIFNIILLDKKGYASHPETRRWEGRLAALWMRHEEQVYEARLRGLPMGADHKTPLPNYAENVKGWEKWGFGLPPRIGLVDPVEQQRKELKTKGCDCKV